MAITILETVLVAACVVAYILKETRECNATSL